MHGWFGYGYGSQVGALGWIGPIMMFLIWGLVVFGIVVLIRYMLVQTRRDSHGSGDSRRETSGSDAYAILAARYARGEIDAAEYEERKRVLDGNSSLS